MNPITTNAIAKSLSYSTTERKTGSTWIDGKYIYKKVVQAETFTSSNPLYVSIPDLDTLIDAKLKRNYDSNNPNWWVIGDGVSSTDNLYIDQSTDTIVIQPVSIEQTIKNFTGIFEYTKTID